MLKNAITGLSEIGKKMFSQARNVKAITEALTMWLISRNETVIPIISGVMNDRISG